MITGKEILLGFIVPVVLAFGGWMIAALAWRRSGTGKWSSPVRVVAVSIVPAVIYAIGFWGIYGWPGWVPIDTTHWLLHFAVIAGVVGMLSAVAGWLGWLSRLILVVVFPWLLLKPVIQYDWTTQIAIVWVATFAVAMLIQMALLEHIGRKVETARFLLIVTTIVGLTALTLAMSGSIALGKRSGILALILLTGFVVSYWLPKERCAVYLVPLITIVTGGLWLSGFYFAELNAVNAILLYSAVVLAWLGLWLRLERLPVWSRLIVHTVLTLLPLVVAFALALSTFLSDNETSSYY